MAKFEVKLDDAWGDFLKNLDTSNEIIKEVLRQTMEEAATIVEGEAKMKAPNNTGLLVGKMYHQVHPSGMSAVIGNSADYAVYVHEGTRPHWPPYQPGTSLHRWAELKGMNPYLVALGISRKGTEPNRFLFDGLSASSNAVVTVFDRGIDEIMKRITV